LVTGVTADPPGATYGPRIPHCYELIWIMEGEAKVTFGKMVFKAKEGTILFRGPGVRDYYEWSTRNQTLHAYVQFDIPSPKNFPIPAKGIPASRSMPPNDVLRPLFSYLLKLDDLKEPGRSGLMVPALELMLQAYFSGQVELKPQSAAQFPDLVEKAVEVMTEMTDQTPPAKLSLTDLSRKVHTSPENLCRLFQKTLHLGPLEYAKMARLDRACNLLRRTNQSLKEIAVNTGFYDSFHLSHSFKKVYGVSPKAFKESRYNEWIAQKNPIIRSLYRRSDLKALADSRARSEFPPKNPPK
jgi:AraC-like DNA-binding protein